MKHFIDLWSPSKADLRAILDEAHRRKTARSGKSRGALDTDRLADGITLAMIFEKNSTRTRFSFDAAIRQLGGESIIVTASDLQLGRGETVEDTARTLSRMVDLVMIRPDHHEDLERFAAASTIPVINGLTDASHPCQIMADLMTFEEHHGRLAGSTFAWLGDGNNVCTTFIQAAPKFGFRLKIAGPDGFGPPAAAVAKARAAGAAIELYSAAEAALADADCVVTDAWTSMGDVAGQEKRRAMLPYRCTPELLALAAPGAIFMHCLPAHRGEEVLDEVIDGSQSVVWDEAENRLHVQKAILLWCLEKLPLSITQMARKDIQRNHAYTV